MKKNMKVNAFSLNQLGITNVKKAGLKRHFTESELVEYLKNKNVLSSLITGEYSDHLDNCLSCWHLWNKVRWDACKHSHGLQELRTYLGDEFLEYFDSSWAIATEWFKQKPKTEAEIAHFYKINRAYLYNLVIWYESGDRNNFEGDLENLRSRFKVNSVVDYGCGVGNDGLLMLKKDFLVNFIDYKCPSTDFLQWRLKTRGYEEEIQDVERIERLPDVEMFWAIDVLEHMKNPLWVIDRLSSKTRVFVHRSEFGNDAGGRHPCHFDFNELRLGEELRRLGFKHIPWPVLSVWVRDE